MKKNKSLSGKRYAKGVLIILVVSLCITAITGKIYGNNLWQNQEQAKAYLLNGIADEWGLLTLYALGEDVSQLELQEMNSQITTDYEAYILGAAAKGLPLAKVTDKIKNTQLASGKFADEIGRKGEDLVNSHIWAVIGLYVAGEEDYNKKTALAWLTSNQNQDGGFPVFAGDNYSDMDLTAMGMIAYSILGLEKEDIRMQNACSFIEKNMDYEESCEALAWMIIAQKFIGMEVESQWVERLSEYRLEDGTYRHLKAIKKNSYIATYSGLLAMSEYTGQLSVFTKLHYINLFSDLTIQTKYIDDITCLLGEEILKGYGDNTFKPAAFVKRAEFAKMLVYSMGIQNEMTSGSQFSDMKGHWAEGVVTLVAKKKIIQGFGNNQFYPDNTITGAEVAAITVRVHGLEAEAKRFQGRNWYDGYVRVALDRGLLYENFKAEKNATRSECARVIRKLEVALSQ